MEPIAVEIPIVKGYIVMEIKKPKTYELLFYYFW